MLDSHLHDPNNEAASRERVIGIQVGTQQVTVSYISIVPIVNAVLDMLMKSCLQLFSLFLLFVQRSLVVAVWARGSTGGPQLD